jgi:hypothetical protein
MDCSYGRLVVTAATETGGSLDWAAEEPKDPQTPRQSPRNASNGASRRSIEVVCCPQCGSLAVGRRVSLPSVSYWQCRDCASRWKESHATGGNGVAVLP